MIHGGCSPEWDLFLREIVDLSFFPMIFPYCHSTLSPVHSTLLYVLQHLSYLSGWKWFLLDNDCMCSSKPDSPLELFSGDLESTSPHTWKRATSKGERKTSKDFQRRKIELNIVNQWNFLLYDKPTIPQSQIPSACLKMT